MLCHIMEFDKAQRISSSNEYCVMLRGTQWGGAEPAKIRFAHSRRDNILAVGTACSIKFGDLSNYNCRRDTCSVSSWFRINTFVTWPSGAMFPFNLSLRTWCPLASISFLLSCELPPSTVGDWSFVPSHPDPNNHTETIIIITLLGLLAQVSY